MEVVVMFKKLTIFIYFWMITMVSIHVARVIYQFFHGGVVSGIVYLENWYAPYRIENFLTVLVTFLPAIVAYLSRDFFQKKNSSDQR